MSFRYRHLFIFFTQLFTFFLLTDAAAREPAQESEIPVLCYHNIRPSLAGHYPPYTISIGQFSNHMKTLADSGFTTILPDQLYDHLTQQAVLPQKPILITFDDSREEQFTLARPVLEKYGFKAVFFVMTVTVNKTGYFSASQIKQLSDSGHCISLHTWDHPDLRKLSPDQWSRQIDVPEKQLERITGKPVKYFAYPYGAWNQNAIDSLMARKIKAAFQLQGKPSLTHPLYTIRRLQVSGSWSASMLLRNIRSASR